MTNDAVRTSNLSLPVVAVFNGHCGIDGWGRPYDFSGALVTIDADVLILPELFLPDDEEPTLPPGYELVTAELARARLVRTASDGREPHRWGPNLLRSAPRAIRIDGPPRRRRRALRPHERRMPGRRGRWCLGLATRLPLRTHRFVELPRLSRDAVARQAIVAELPTSSGELTVVAAHLGHVSHGAWRQVRALGRELADAPAAVLGGDMNCWGPPLLALLPGWQRAVRGRTWPAWRPHSQIDHLLVHGNAVATAGTVLPPLGSDHRAIRAAVGIAAAVTPTAAAKQTAAPLH